MSLYRIESPEHDTEFVDAPTMIEALDAWQNAHADAPCFADVITCIADCDVIRAPSLATPMENVREAFAATAPAERVGLAPAAENTDGMAHLEPSAADVHRMQREDEARLFSQGQQPDIRSG